MPDVPDALSARRSPPARDLLERGELLVLALVLSLLIHAALLYFSRAVLFRPALELRGRSERLFRVKLREEEPQTVLRPLAETGPEREQEMEKTLAQRLEELNAQPPLAEAPPAPPAAFDPASLDQPQGPAVEPGPVGLAGALASIGGSEGLPSDPLGVTGRTETRTSRPLRTRPEFVPQPDLPPVTVSAPGFVVVPPPQPARVPALPTPPLVARSEPMVPIDVPPAPAPEMFAIRESIGARIKAKGILPIDEYLDIRLDVYHAPGEESGFFRLRLVPNHQSGKLRVMRKDVAFVLDCSRSMGSRGLRESKDGLRDAILSLRETDRFNVLGFKTTVSQFADGLVPASMANKGAALRFVDDLSASGRTNIYMSLIPISQAGGGEDHPFIVFLCSDGLPTYGVTDSRRIINDMTAQIKPNSSIFVAGVGKRQNTYLLDMLARRNKGFANFSTEIADIQSVVRNTFAEVQDPLLINVRLDFQEQAIAETTYPRRVPDLYRTGKIDLYGRYTTEKTLTVHFTGRFEDKPRDAVISLPFPETDHNDPSIAAQWARNKLYELVGIQCEQGDSPALTEEIRRLNRTYALKIPYVE